MNYYDVGDAVPFRLPEGMRIRLKEKVKHQKLNALVEETRDGSVSNVLKVIRSIFGVVGVFSKEVQEGTKGLSNHISSVADTFKFMGVFSDVKSIVEHAEKKGVKGRTKVEKDAKIAAGALGLGIGVLTGTRILNTVGIISISEISASVGRMGVVGASVARFLPFATVASLFEIARASLGIVAGVCKFRAIGDKVEKENGKKTFWSQDLQKQQIAGRKIEIRSKINKKVASLDGLKAKIIEWNEPVILGANLLRAKKRRLERKEARVNAKKGFSYLAARVSLASENSKFHAYEKSFKGVAKERLKLFRQFEKIRKEHDHLVDKHNAWNAIDQAIDDGSIHSEENQQALAAFKSEKLQKHKIKKENLNLDRTKEGLGIGFNTVLVVTLVATVVFGYMGILGASTIALSIASSFLFISVYALSNSLFKKYKTPEKVHSVPVPALAPAAG